MALRNVSRKVTRAHQDGMILACHVRRGDRPAVSFPGLFDTNLAILIRALSDSAKSSWLGITCLAIRSWRKSNDVRRQGDPLRGFVRNATGIPEQRLVPRRAPGVKRLKTPLTMSPRSRLRLRIAIAPLMARRSPLERWRQKKCLLAPSCSALLLLSA